MDTPEEMVAALAVVPDHEPDDRARPVELFRIQGWMGAAEAERWRELIRGRRLLAQFDGGGGPPKKDLAILFSSSSDRRTLFSTPHSSKGGRHAPIDIAVGRGAVVWAELGQQSGRATGLY